MAKYVEINNKTDLLAFVYDPDTLPTAMMRLDSADFSVHSLREGEVDLLEKIFGKDGEEIKKDGTFSKAVRCYKFYEDYIRDYDEDRVCWGMHFSAKQDHPRLKIKHIEQWAVKSFDMCA